MKHDDVLPLGQRITQSILNTIGSHPFEFVMALIIYYFSYVFYKKYLQIDRKPDSINLTMRYGYLIMRRRYNEKI